METLATKKLSPGQPDTVQPHDSELVQLWGLTCSQLQPPDCFSSWEMELGKCASSDPLWKERLKEAAQHVEQTGARVVEEHSALSFPYRQQVASGSGFLTFTFVPSFGRLPNQFHVVDAPSFLVKVSENAGEKSYPEITNKIAVVAESQVPGGGNKENGEVASCTNRRHEQLKSKQRNASKGKMEANDLFKAELVFISDSDEDKNTAAGNGYGHARALILDTSPLSTNGVKLRSTSPLSHADHPHHSASQQKTTQLTSPLSTSDHLSHKSPIAHLLSQTHLKAEHALTPTHHQTVQESQSQSQSVNGSSIHQSSTYSQSTACYRLPSPVLKRPSFPFDSLSKRTRLQSTPQASKLSKMSESTLFPLPSKDAPISSKIPSSVDSLHSSSPQALSPSPSKQFTTVPIHITTHLLSPSPQPFSSPFHGSSSTISSVNNLCSQMSSSGNLLKSGTRSPLPTRLSFLTAILKSGSSPKRPFSPASCPATFSSNSLASSTLTLDQKFKTTPPTPKKSASHFCIRSDSPCQDEFHLSVFSNVPNHMTLKSSPTLRVRSLSPKRTLSPDKLHPLAPSISSFRKTVLSPLLQPKLPNSSLPPPAPRNIYSQITSKGAHSPGHRPQGPERSRKVHTHSPTFTAKSFAVSTPAMNQRDTFSPSSEKCSLSSPTFLHPTYKPKVQLPQVSAKNPNTQSPSPSFYWPFSHTGSTSPSPPANNIHTPSRQFNSSSVHQSYRACPSSSRPRTPTVAQPRSPPFVRSPLSRSRELTSPLSFPLLSDSENRTSKPYTIKTSYKDFAAIPTNTLLLEQKALDEPIKTGVTQDTALDTRSETCSPAQFRQQTEELCAAIDEVLQAPLSMRRCDSSPSSLQTIMDSDRGKMSTTLQRPAGRETRFANLYLSRPALPRSQKTKPGVIRPTTVKAKIIFKKEDPVQPNPFKKYLDETKASHKEQPTHPMVPIPENETLSSKELRSARLQHRPELSPCKDYKEQSKENLQDNASLQGKTRRVSRGDDVGAVPAKFS